MSRQRARSNRARGRSRPKITPGCRRCGIIGPLLVWNDRRRKRLHGWPGTAAVRVACHEVQTMKQFGIALAMLSMAAVSSAQQTGEFQPAETNVWGAQYPRVDATGRVQIRIKAPDAAKARVNFWSGPKVDMEKQPDGFWTVV